MATLSRKSSSTVSAGNSRAQSAARREQAAYREEAEKAESQKSSTRAAALQSLNDELNEAGAQSSSTRSSFGSAADRGLSGMAVAETSFAKDAINSRGLDARNANEARAQSSANSSSRESSGSDSVQKVLAESSSDSASKSLGGTSSSGLNEQKSFESSTRAQESSSSGASMSSGQSMSESRQNGQMSKQDCEQSSTTQKISIAAALDELGAEKGSALLNEGSVSVGRHRTQSVSRTESDGVTYTEELREDRKTSYEADGESGDVFKTLAQSTCASATRSMDESTASHEAGEFSSKMASRMDEARQDRHGSSRDAAESEVASKEAAAAEAEMDMAD